MTGIYKSDALASVHKAMEGLHKVGAISDEKAKEFNDHCLEKIRPIAAYAAVHTDVARGGPWIISGSVRRTAKEVRQWIGPQFAWNREDPSEGWKMARKQGVRVIRVVVSAEVQP